MYVCYITYMHTYIESARAKRSEGQTGSKWRVRVPGGGGGWGGGEGRAGALSCHWSAALGSSTCREVSRWSYIYSQKSSVYRLLYSIC
jgi:hypothetical protein